MYARETLIFIFDDFYSVPIKGKNRIEVVPDWVRTAKLGVRIEIAGRPPPVELPPCSWPWMERRMLARTEEPWGLPEARIAETDQRSVSD